ncbi:MAG TPA: FxDxF family PEP-CTERM protein [Nitrospira sp.]|nr:FxDxF family PEP-CTERM protein [Nitrospira sp.]HNG53370.1 FxDxF family PEP-CTERM protein [Nitrospira sp.]
MQIRKIAALCALMAAAASASAATTATYQGTLDGNDQLLGTFDATTGAFSSSFTFYNVSAADAWLEQGSTQYHYLFSGNGVLNLGMFTVPWQQVALGSGSLGAGTWELHVQGTAGGQYAGGITYDAGSGSMPVPEPESAAMLMAGLGVLGMLRRRSANKKA